MNLTKELLNAQKGFKERVPLEIQKEMQNAQEELIQKKILIESIGVNDYFPDFELPNQANTKVSLSQLLEGKKYLVISFYRGGWCRYCNLELRALESKRKKFDELGVGLVAITPERPDYSKETSKTNEVDFNVLSDFNSKLAQEIGISFELPENLKPIYNSFGINVSEHNGENSFTLPVPATFLIDAERKIHYEFKDLDYTLRLDPDELLKKISSLE